MQCGHGVVGFALFFKFLYSFCGGFVRGCNCYFPFHFLPTKIACDLVEEFFIVVSSCHKIEINFDRVFVSIKHSVWMMVPYWDGINYINVEISIWNGIIAMIKWYFYNNILKLCGCCIT